MAKRPTAIGPDTERQSAMTTIQRNGISLSANATANDSFLMPTVRHGGDFASRMGGRIRRNDRRTARMAKAAFLMSCLEG